MKEIIFSEVTMSVYVLLAEGFEELEALTPVDYLRRLDVAVETLSCGPELTVRGAHGIPVPPACLSIIGYSNNPTPLTSAI